MKKLLAFILILLLLGPNYSSAGDLTDEQQRIGGLERAINAAVKITITQGSIEVPSSTGSGFFIAPNTILTNAHVVLKSGITAIKVTKSDGTICKGKLGYREEAWDMALVSVDCTGSPLTVATGVQVGQDAYIVGSSTVDFAVTQGIVSKLDEKSHLLLNLHASHGDSGSAVVNSDGQVIGVLRSGESPFIYAIPIKYINAFLQRAGVSR